MLQDNEGDMYDAIYREYHYIQGRWLSPDPMGGDITNPQSLNRYAYVMNNPTGRTDPLGLCVSGGTGPCGWVYYPSGAGCEVDPWACGGGGGGGGAIWGNDIFDAVSGAPGTYLTLDMYGNVGFGFSVDLWQQTENYIDTTRQNNQALAFLVPTSGYVVVERNLGTGVETSGLIPDMEAMAQERLQLANMVGAGGYYLDYLAKYGFSPENPIGQNYVFWQTMLNVENSWEGLGYSQDPTVQYGGYLNAYSAQYQNFLVYQANFLNFIPRGW
jgi:RHS repeat-associated protein